MASYTFNGNSFDLPVLRYRAMVHGVSAPGLSARPYFHRYTEDAVDLCDVFSSFSPQGKATLHEIIAVMGLPGKPKGFDGSEVERYFREGKIKDVADYCETDVVGTYQVWLRYEPRIAHRYSIMTVRPSIQPSSRNRCTKAPTRWLSNEGVLASR